MNPDNDKKGAAVKFPPPFIFLLSILVAYGVHYIWPMGISTSPWLDYASLAILALAMTAVVLTVLSFKRAKTHIEPWKPTTAIISTGIFACSRNPIYLAFCLMTVGTGLFLNSVWVLLSALPAAILVYHIAIKKEEAYLESKFGEQYLQYKRKVRRWL